MNTPTHLLIGAAVLVKSRTSVGESDSFIKRYNTAILVGALAPDLALFVMFGWMRWVVGVSEDTLWREIYWLEPWQTVFAIGNSVPLFIALLIGGVALRKSLTGKIMIGFATAALLHIAFDLPFHHEDAHRHFWPLSDWRFYSPLSYWNPDHHGDVVAYVEIAMAMGLIFVLWRRFSENRYVKTLLTMALISYIAVPAYFNFMLGD